MGSCRPLSEMRRNPSGRGRCTRYLRTVLSTTTHTRFTATHQPGALPGASAAITAAMTASTTTEARDVNASMTGVSASERRTLNKELVGHGIETNDLPARNLTLR